MKLVLNVIADAILAGLATWFISDLFVRTPWAGEPDDTKKAKGIMVALVVAAVILYGISEGVN